MAEKTLFDKPTILTPEQVRFYQDNGYLEVRNALSVSECKKAVKVFERHARRSGNVEYKAVMNLDRPEEWRHVYGPNGHWTHSYVRLMLARNPVLVTVLETLHGLEPGQLVLMQTMFLYKKAQTEYAPQAWNPHQDGCYHGSPFEATLTGNLALTDQDRENGCMFIHPGSHKEGHFLESERKTSFHEGRNSRPGHDVSNDPIYKERYAGKEIELPLQQGSLLVLHGGVVHGSYPNLSKGRDRPMYLAPYKTLGVPFSYGTDGKRMEIPTR